MSLIDYNPEVGDVIFSPVDSTNVHDAFHSMFRNSRSSWEIGGFMAASDTQEGEAERLDVSGLVSMSLLVRGIMTPRDQSEHELVIFGDLQDVENMGRLTIVGFEPRVTPDENDFMMVYDRFELLDPADHPYAA